MNDIFLKFETEVILKILSENIELENQFRLQYANASIIEREFSGYGFFTKFKVDPKYRLSNHENETLGNVKAEINDLKHGVGFVLFIENGLISILECYTYDEPFPNVIKYYKLY